MVVNWVWDAGWWFWSGSVKDGALSTPREWLRHFILLKLVMVLLFPHGVDLPLLVGCMFSLQALLLLRSPHISTKPSTVVLGQLALTDSLLLLRWVLRLGVTLGLWAEEGAEAEAGLIKEGHCASSLLCQRLIDAHQLASLLMLGLLGLEATLVSHWPLQTRRFRTSHSAQLSCGLVWLLVLLESLASKPVQDPRPLTDYSTQQDPQLSSLDLVPPSSLPALSVCLRRVLWLLNLWLHYAALYRKPQRRKSHFH
ncbi:uncharacterized protein LOC142992908 [Genypterus blacodes]|uniref:uncharacterized protein LOC142992908 n=1 Tax=Genypterus blacodes TaxID=154954 RepID=UPI003F7598B0